MSEYEERLLDFSDWLDPHSMTDKDPRLTHDDLVQSYLDHGGGPSLHSFARWLQVKGYVPESRVAGDLVADFTEGFSHPEPDVPSNDLTPAEIADQLASKDNA